MYREKQVFADMHTHSEFSHDSTCKIEDMCAAQAAKGTDIMAVTDHFDTASDGIYDLHAPIAACYENVAKCRETSRQQCRLLFGVEIGESFWVPEAYEKVRQLCPYDVIIGSVHLVRYPGHYEAYSQIDFSQFSEEELHGYLKAYFADMCTMLDALDFDILAHMTNPLRYMVGKYHRKVDISRYDQEIDHILKTIIQKGIALEVNTSSFDALGDWIPSRQILCRYRDLGGYLITLGSDAHVAASASLHFEEALQELKNLGFRELFYYVNRVPIAYNIICEGE